MDHESGPDLSELRILVWTEKSNELDQCSSILIERQ
jgi:hypothetical protein